MIGARSRDDRYGTRVRSRTAPRQISDRLRCSHTTNHYHPDCRSSAKRIASRSARLGVGDTTRGNAYGRMTSVRRKNMFRTSPRAALAAAALTALLLTGASAFAATQSYVATLNAAS